MKTNKLLNLLFAAAFLGIIFTGCKKEDDSPAQITDNTTIASAQDEESQDALAENTDQNMDGILDGIEANDFTGLKTASVGDPSITISQKDTITFPKTITLVYNTDTTINDERFRQTGTITITIALQAGNGPWRNRLKRTITLSNFTVATDSASFTINGTRVMTRKSVKLSVNNIATPTKLRLAVSDSIKSQFYFIVQVGDAFKDTFSRNVAKKRDAIAHFERSLVAARWHQAFLQDTLKFEGKVSGLNFRNQEYSRTITSPLIFTRCAFGAVVISSGVIQVTRAAKTATLTYSQDGCSTKVVLESEGKVKEITRKTNRLFRHWW